MNAAAIPVELRERPQWVVWKRLKRGGKLTKVPYRAVDARTTASVDDPQTWGTFEQAIARAAEVQGIGYVFSADDPYCGVDLDGCVDAQTGELHPAAGEILERLGGYQEHSPSGAGMHAIVAAELRGDRHRTADTPWGDKFEVYDRGRFFTITGDGSGAVVERQEQLDEVVARMFGEASQNGAGPSTEPQDGAGVDAQAILDQHEDLAKIAARKGTKPKGGTASDWDYMLAARAAEHGYDDGALVALIRHARWKQGEDKGERPDYAERTVKAVRRHVGYVGTGADHDQILAELTRAIRLDRVDRHVVETFVAGHGNTAAATILLDDGYAIEFPSFEHVAQPGKLADQLSTTVGITTDFSKLQSRRVASLVRLAASRREELRDHAVYVDEAIRLLELAQTREFDFDHQPEKWEAWAQIDSTDPELIPQGPEFETDTQRHRRESRTAEIYAKRVVIPVDRASGVLFVRASWLQQFMRLKLGPSSTPQRVRLAVLRAGWRVRGNEGRIKATDPLGVAEPLVFAFYLVPAGWREKQAGDAR